MSMSEMICNTYCRRLREVKALQFRDNVEQLQSFVIGGELSSGKTPSGKRVFIFHGLAAFEDDWIATEDGVNFEVMTDEHFRRDYEPK